MEFGIYNIIYTAKICPVLHGPLLSPSDISAPVMTGLYSAVHMNKHWTSPEWGQMYFCCVIANYMCMYSRSICQQGSAGHLAICEWSSVHVQVISCEVHIYDKDHTSELRIKSRSERDRRSYSTNKAHKTFQTDSNSWPPRYWCDALPTELHVWSLARSKSSVSL